MMKFKLIMFLVYLATIAVACFKLKKDLNENYEKEKHADVYESHMRMFKKMIVLNFNQSVITITLFFLVVIDIFKYLIELFF